MVTLEADDGGSEIVAPQTLGRLVQLVAWSLAIPLALSLAIQSGTNCNMDLGDYGDCDCFR